MTEEHDAPSSSERGAVLVWVGIMLPLLLAFAGLAIDVGSWYVRAQRQQNAADAAALAASIYMPQDFDEAQDTARDVAARNGFDAGEVTVLRTSKPSQIRVQITRTRGNFFGGILGVVDRRITRDAVGEYQPSVPMGSPASTFGNEPLGAGDQRWSNIFTTPESQPRFWATIAGPGTEKVQGDAFHSGICVATYTDLCGTGTRNAEYNPNGNLYTIRVPSKPSGATAFQVEVFDPAFVRVGSRCTERIAGATAATNPYVTDPAVRYAANEGPYCTGDALYGSPSTTDATTTTFVLRAPSATPWDPLSGDVIDTGTCQPQQFEGFDTNLQAALTAPGGNDRLQRVFRRWVPICTIAAPAAGDYVLQVRTNVRFGASKAAMAGAGDPTTPGGGGNRYALRAGFVNGVTLVAANVRIFTTSSMSIFANAPATTEFYLARVPSGSGGKRLVVSLFDIADATRPADLYMVPPAGTSFSGCSISGAVERSLPDCVVRDAVTTQFNGRWARVTIPIPRGYTCNDADPRACWVKIRFAYATADSQVTDVTTWAASMEGDPVRLIE